MYAYACTVLGRVKRGMGEYAAIYYTYFLKLTIVVDITNLFLIVQREK